MAAAQHVLDVSETADCWYWHELMTASRCEDMNSTAVRYQHYSETTSYRQPAISTMILFLRLRRENPEKSSMQKGPAHLFILAGRSKGSETRGHGCDPLTGIGSESGATTQILEPTKCDRSMEGYEKEMQISIICNT